MRLNRMNLNGRIGRVVPQRIYDAQYVPSEIVAAKELLEQAYSRLCNARKASPNMVDRAVLDDQTVTLLALQERVSKLLSDINQEGK